MISFRQLIVIVLVIGIVWLLGSLRRRLGEKSSAQTSRADQAQYNFDETVRCRHCGVYMLKREAAGNDSDGYTCRDPACLTSRKRWSVNNINNDCQPCWQTVIDRSKRQTSGISAVAHYRYKISTPWLGLIHGKKNSYTIISEGATSKSWVLELW